MKELINSAQLFERAKKVTPGGVHSPVRAFKAVGGTPPFIDSASGACLRDVGRQQLPRLLHVMGTR